LSYIPARSSVFASLSGRATSPLIEPNWWELPAVFLLAATLAAADVWEWHAEETMNYLAPIWLSLALGLSATQMGMADSRAIWTPLFWFRIATIVYFGLGSIVPMIVNGESRIYMQSFYIFLAPDIERVNLVAAVGVACVLGANLIFEKIFGPKATPESSFHGTGGGKDALVIGLGMFSIGAAVNYLIVVPNNLFGGDPLPGFLVNMTAFELVGISLLALWSLDRSWKAVLAVCAVVVIEGVFGLLMFTKATALYPLVAFVIGFLTHKVTVPRLALSGLVLWLFYGSITPLVNFARNERVALSAGAEDISLAQRVQFLAAYYDVKKDENDPEAIQEGLLRVSFINAAAFVISQYDHGLPGDSLVDVAYSFIPRVLWPEKPIVTVASDLATLAAGQFGNNISAGYFAEAYWNLGWIGLPLLMFPVGVCFNLGTHFAARIVAQKDWLYMPVLFLYLKVSQQVDTWYIGFVGTTMQCVALYVLLKFGGQGLRSIGLMPPAPNRA
jgi:hypothetical protein